MRIVGQPGNHGSPAHRPASLAVLRRALDLGIRFIDTADAYGPGVSEELVAEALHPYPDDLVVATKGGVVKTGPAQMHAGCSSRPACAPANEPAPRSRSRPRPGRRGRPGQGASRPGRPLRRQDGRRAPPPPAGPHPPPASPADLSLARQEGPGHRPASGRSWSVARPRRGCRTCTRTGSGTYVAHVARERRTGAGPDAARRLAISGDGPLLCGERRGRACRRCLSSCCPRRSTVTPVALEVREPTGSGHVLEASDDGCPLPDRWPCRHRRR